MMRSRGRHEDRLRSVAREHALDAIASGVMILRLGSTPEVEHANGAVRALTGAEPEELLQRGLDAIEANADTQRARDTLRAGREAQIEATLARPDGTRVACSVRLLPVLDDAGALSRIVVVLTDVTDRVRGREALADSERRYRLLAEHSRDIVARHAPDGTLVYVSPAVKAILGYEPEDLLDADLADFVHPDDLVRLRADHHANLHGAPARPLRFRARHASGRYRWLERTTTVVRDAAGDVVELQTASRDVTRRILADRALSLSEENFRRLFKASPQPMWIYDDDTLRLLDVNEPTLELLGYSREELLAMTVADLYHEGDAAEVKRTLAGVPDRYTRFGDIVVRTRAGGHIEVVLDKSPVRMHGRWARLVVAHDVTGIREAERARSISERRFRAIVERSNDIFVITDNRGTMRYASEAVRRVLGLEPDELVGVSYNDRIHPDDMPAILAARADIDRDGEALLPYYRFRHADGSWHWLEATSKDLRDDPAIGGVLVTTRDVTERMTHLNEVRATREGTLRALGVALEYRDYETKGHTDRVVDLSQRFARTLGFDTRQQQALTWGAYLHDIGKIAMPDQILLKPGRLSEDEYAVIRRHTLIGVDMCRDIPFLREGVLDVVRSHHERWDGSGYPDNLAGDAIPLAARMFSLVDVYDALTSERPYKRAWSRADAVAELRAQAGAQFDPGLVDVFLTRVLG